MAEETENRTNTSAAGGKSAARTAARSGGKKPAADSAAAAAAAEKEAAVPSEKAVKAAKKEKRRKKIPAKKLPGIYKKRYTEKTLEKKLLSRLYIEADRDLIRRQFLPVQDKKGRAFLRVDRAAALPKADFNRLKLVAKQIKQQKGAVKLVPLLAVVVLIAGIGICVTLFKNIILKKAITSAMQGIFQARTDIGLVDLRIFGASIDIQNLEQANKDSPMKNIFQIDQIHLDFNLTELLRGKFAAESLVVSGVALDTDRKTSGELPVTAKTKETKEEKKTESAASVKAAELVDAAASDLKAMFENYNPETMLAGLQEQIQSPAVAAEVAAQVQEKIGKWSAVPAQIQASVENFSSGVNSVIKTDWGGISDVTKLQAALKTVGGAVEEGKALQKTVTDTAGGMEADALAVKEYSERLAAAVRADTSLVQTTVKDLQATFSVDGMTRVMNNAVESMLYTALGKYYPYFNQAVGAALALKANSASSGTEEKSSEEKKKSEKSASSASRRMAGRDVYYRKNTVPKFLIQNAVASGYEYGTGELLFKGTATEISSDQDLRGKPATVAADFKISGCANHADVVVDARSASAAPLVTALYTGSGYPIAADAQVFALKSASDISARLTADSDGSFSVGGSLDMTVSQMTGMTFEPEKVCEIYQRVLSGIRRLTIGFTAGYSADSGIFVKIENPEKLAMQLVTPLTAALKDELAAIAEDAAARITALLSEKTGGVTDSLTQFTDIQSALDAQRQKLDELNASLQAKNAEILKKIEEQTKAAVTSKAEEALESVVPGGLKNLLKK